MQPYIGTFAALGRVHILRAFPVSFSPFLVKIDKKEVKTCGRKSIEESIFLRYNKATKKYENANYIYGMEQAY